MMGSDRYLEARMAAPHLLAECQRERDEWRSRAEAWEASSIAACDQRDAAESELSNLRTDILNYQSREGQLRAENERLRAQLKAATAPIRTEAERRVLDVMGKVNTVSLARLANTDEWEYLGKALLSFIDARREAEQCERDTRYEQHPQDRGREVDK